MPRYYFNSENGRAFPDEEGTELDNLAAVRAEAVAVLGELLREHRHEFWATGAWCLTVVDEHNLTLLTLDVVSTLSPAGSADGGIGPSASK